MSQEQKTLKTLSIIEFIAAAIYVIEGILVPSVKESFYVSGVFLMLTALMCLVAVNDASKATAAKILLGTTMVINLLGMILQFFNGTGGSNLGTAALSVCISAYMFKLIGEIHPKKN